MHLTYMYICTDMLSVLHVRPQECIIKKSREEERVTLVVAVVTAESPACTISRASCYMPAHLASLSKCEILVGSSFSIGRGLNGCANQTLNASVTINILFLLQAGDSACFTKH